MGCTATVATYSICIMDDIYQTHSPMGSPILRKFVDFADVPTQVWNIGIRITLRGTAISADYL